MKCPNCGHELNKTEQYESLIGPISPMTYKGISRALDEHIKLNPKLLKCKTLSAFEKMVCKDAEVLNGDRAHIRKYFFRLAARQEGEGKKR